MDGIDTIANIYLNNKLVAKTENQFRKYKFNVKEFLFFGINNISVTFFSPVNYAKLKAKEYEVNFKIKILICMLAFKWTSNSTAMHSSCSKWRM